MVAVVILNYNGRAFLDKFLPLVIAHSVGHQIYVADNASTDDSVAFLKKHYPAVGLIQLSENTGYAGGYNRALAQVEAQYYVLLNSDVAVSHRWIEPMQALMDENPQIAACQPKILDYNDPKKFEYAGAAGGFLDQLGYAYCQGRIFDTVEADQGQYQRDRPIHWATGACMFVRADAFKNAGGFDEQYFAHYEEIDLCWRLRNAGHQVWYCAASAVYHVGGGTLHKSNPQKTFLNFRNNLLTIYKNESALRAALVVAARLVLDGLAGVQLFFKGQFAEVWAIIRAHFAFYGMVAGAWGRAQKRGAMAQNLPPKKIRSVVFQYFVLKRKYFLGL